MSKRKKSESRASPAKRKIKDSIFTALCSKPEYLKEVYLCIRWEDTDVKEKDISIDTISNIFFNGSYNDLTFTVRKRDMYLLEAQSTLCANMEFRIVNYYLTIIQKKIPYFVTRQYSAAPMKDVPVPHFYVLYTGNRKAPESYETGQDFFRSDDADLSVRVRVLTKNTVTGILRQYCLFCENFDLNRGKYGYTEDAVFKTVEYCMKQDILKEFLSENMAEVKRIMCESNEQELLNREQELINRERELINRKMRRLYTDEKKKCAEEQKKNKQYRERAERFRKGANLTPEQKEFFEKCFS